LHAVLVGVEASQRLAEHLGDAIAAVGPRIDVVVDGAVAPVEADRVVAGREDDALHAVLARRLEDVVAADDVRLQDVLPPAFHRIAAEVHDRIDAPGDLHRVGHLRDVGLDEILRLERTLVGEPQLVLAGELAREVRADVPGGAGDEYGLHGFRFQWSALTAPFGALPFAISAACATVSIDWCSIAGTVRPAMCGVAITSGRAASGSIGIWSGARPTSMAQPPSWPLFSAASSACSSTRLPRETLMRNEPFFIFASAFASIRFSVSSVATASGTTKSDSPSSFSKGTLFRSET